MSPKFFLLRNAFPHQRCYISTTREPSVPVACGCIPCAPQARPPAPCSVRLLVESIVQNRDLSGKQSQILSRSPTMQAVWPAPRNGSRRPRSSPATPSGAPCSARCARSPRHPRTRVAQREIFSRIATARGNNHRSCLAAPLCKLSGRSFRADHGGPDQAQPRPRQPPVARAAATNVGHRGGQGGWPPCSQEIFRI